MMLCVLLVEHLREALSLPRSLALLPDALSAIAAIVVIVAGTRTRFRDVDGKYVVVFGLLLMHIAAGAIANHLTPGVLVNGLRIYLKGLPFFFLPLVLAIDERSLRRQLILVALISLVQFPIAWHQRQTTAGRRQPVGRPDGRERWESRPSCRYSCAPPPRWRWRCT